MCSGNVLIGSYFLVYLSGVQVSATQVSTGTQTDELHVEEFVHEHSTSIPSSLSSYRDEEHDTTWYLPSSITDMEDEAMASDEEEHDTNNAHQK